MATPNPIKGADPNSVECRHSDVEDAGSVLFCNLCGRTLDRNRVPLAPPRLRQKIDARGAVLAFRSPKA